MYATKEFIKENIVEPLVDLNGDGYDLISKPKHYNREGAMECFDEFVLIHGVEAGKIACLFNIHKYRYRAADKNGEQDLLKSDWYMAKYKELEDKDNGIEWSKLP